MSISHGLIWGYIERWGNKVISLAVFIVLARLLEPRDFGLVAFAKLFIDYLDVFAGQGLGLAIIQRKNLTDKHLSTAFWIILIISILLSVLLVIVAPLIESIFAETGIANVLRILALLIIINALSRIQVAILTREQRFKGLAIRGLAMSLVGGAVGVTMAFYGYGVWSLVFQHTVGAFVALLVLWGAVAWRPHVDFSVVAAKDMYAFASRIIVEQQVIFVSGRFDEILVSALLGTTALGYYSVAKRIFSTLMDMFYSAMAKVLISNFSRLQDDKQALMEKANRVTVVIAAVTFPVFIAGAFANHELISVLFGEKWRPAAPIFAILMVSGLFLLTPNVFHNMFQAVGRPDITLRLNTTRAVLSLVAISGGSIFGTMGIALGILVRSIIGATLDFLKVRSVLALDVDRNLLIQLTQIAYCIPMLLVLFGIDLVLAGSQNHIIQLVYYLFAGSAVYFFTLVLFKAQVVRDGKIFFKALFQK